MSLSPNPLSRPWVQRLLLLCFGIGVAVALVSLAELGLGLAGVGKDLRLFIPDEQPGYHRTNPDFSSVFTPASFGLQPAPFKIATKKPGGTKRVFVVGESAVMGVPSPEFGIVPQLRALLRAQHPGANVEVYNIGITAINSHVLVWAVRDLVEFEPDLVVFYTGNNEVVGPYGPGSFYASEAPPLWLARLSARVKRTRVAQLLSQLVSRGKAEPRWGGMQMFAEHSVTADDKRLSQVFANFRENLETMVTDAQASGAEVILATVVANLTDCAPFASASREDLTQSQRTRWQQLFQEGVAAWRLGKTAAAEARLQDARELDPGHATTWWILGRLALERGQISEARRAFREAMHRDTLRFRPDARINDAIRSVAAANVRITLVDTATLMGYEGENPERLPGGEAFYEHVHFTLKGAHEVAAHLARAAAPILRPGSAVGISPDLESTARAVGWNPFAAHRSYRVIHAQGSLAPFTGQVTFVEDCWRRQQELDRVLAPFLDPATGKPKREATDGVIAALTRAIEADPANPDLLRLRMEVLLLAEQPNAAASDLKAWEKLVPATGGAAVQRAQVLTLNNQRSEAIRHLRLAAANEQHTSLALVALAQSLAEDVRASEARELLSKRLAMGSPDGKVAALLADLLAGAGDSGGAAAILGQHLEWEPSDSAALEHLCQLLDTAGDTEGVRAWRMKLAEAQRHNVANAMFVAEAHQAAGNSAEAFRFIEAACATGYADSTAFILYAQALSERGDIANTVVNLMRARDRAEAVGNRTAAREIVGLLDYYQTQLPF
ncbi:MAG: tetratricopeptide repeat protein [Opitutaceae bacterium]|nr:tetratricopeptide repeat protein [Opitutaceae bacterium]